MNIDFHSLPLEVKNEMENPKEWEIVEIRNTSLGKDYLSYNTIQINGNLVFFVNALKTGRDDEWFFIKKTYSLAYFDDLKKAKEFVEKRNK